MVGGGLRCSTTRWTILRFKPGTPNVFGVTGYDANAGHARAGARL